MRGFILVACIIGGALCVHADPPAPSAEVNRLSFWIGAWKIEAEATPNPVYPTGKYSSELNCDWFQGKFQVICRFEWKGPEEPYTELQIFGYTPENGNYYTYDIDSTGFGSAADGSVSGNTWTYLYNDLRVNGKSLRMLWTVIDVSPTSFTWKTEISEKNGPWKPAGLARATRK